MSRAGVEALGLLWGDVRELRHTILVAVVSCAVVSCEGWLCGCPLLASAGPAERLPRGLVLDRAGAAFKHTHVAVQSEYLDIFGFQQRFGPR